MTTLETTQQRTPIGGRDRKRRRLVIGAVAAVVVLVVAVVVAITTGSDDDTATTGTTATTTTTEGSTTRPGGQTTATSVAPTTATPAPTSGSRASAADALEPFFTAAATMDDQLRAAATAINGEGPPWTAVSPEVADAVGAAELLPVARAIPAGLPPDLLRGTVLVFSDLTSRRFAMASFEHAGDFPYQPIDLLGELANGHAAAGRFDDDVAALRSLATSTPPITVQPPDSRAAAEVTLLVAYVGIANGGCDSRGGVVITEPPVITWASERTGTIGGIGFTVEPVSGGTWHAQLDAC